MRTLPISVSFTKYRSIAGGRLVDAPGLISQGKVWFDSIALQPNKLGW